MIFDPKKATCSKSQKPTQRRKGDYIQDDYMDIKELKMCELYSTSLKLIKFINNKCDLESKQTNDEATRKGRRALNKLEEISKIIQGETFTSLRQNNRL